MAVKKYIETGKIVTTHGIKGEVKIQPWCDSPYMFEDFDDLFFDQGKTKAEIENIRVQKNVVIAKFKGIEDINAAQLLRDKIIYADRDNFDLEQGSYFIQDLIGLSVIDDDNGAEYGKVIDIISTGANDVYVVKKSDDKQYLVPAIADVIIKTDIPNSKIFIKPLKGLFEDED